MKTTARTAKQLTRERSAKILDLLTRLQTATQAIADKTSAGWIDAANLDPVLQQVVYAAFAAGVINEADSRALGFPC